MVVDFVRAGGRLWDVVEELLNCRIWSIAIEALNFRPKLLLFKFLSPSLGKHYKFILNIKNAKMYLRFLASLKTVTSWIFYIFQPLSRFYSGLAPRYATLSIKRPPSSFNLCIVTSWTMKPISHETALVLFIHRHDLRPSFFSQTSNSGNHSIPDPDPISHSQHPLLQQTSVLYNSSQFMSLSCETFSSPAQMLRPVRKGLWSLHSRSEYSAHPRLSSSNSQNHGSSSRIKRRKSLFGNWRNVRETNLRLPMSLDESCERFNRVRRAVMKPIKYPLKVCGRNKFLTSITSLCYRMPEWIQFCHTCRVFIRKFRR
jgi:hypothetical protein